MAPRELPEFLIPFGDHPYVPPKKSQSVNTGFIWQPDPSEAPLSSIHPVTVIEYPPPVTLRRPNVFVRFARFVKRKAIQFRQYAFKYDRREARSDGAEGETGGSDQVGRHGARPLSPSNPYRATNATEIANTHAKTEDMQAEAVEVAQDAMAKYTIEKDIAQYIKKTFDERRGPTWHCIVGRNFGSFVTHETKHFVYFYLGHCAILLFKTQ